MKGIKSFLILSAAALAPVCGIFAEEPAKPVMLPVRGGSFLMGSNEGALAANERVHEVTVRSFLISETEVTQELYVSVMNENPSFFKGGDLPVDSVSWMEAVLFCNALSLRFGFAPAYIVNGENVIWNQESRGYRLPTEAEWEYAARGGVYGADGEALIRAFFAGGDASADPREYGWFAQNSERKTHPVKGRKPNQLGIYDMSGNVWEWCWDLYGVYPADPVSDYAGSDTGKNRIYRGGSYLNNLPQLRTTFRIWDAPAFKARSIGFRIARNG
ncbi:MAG: formylglycine-generating enzyme family protein [Treponema sp.]|jgi:formylglycine-generating enzyme required for sulfatase activity|nr:formylglycine-generating enzyme family protein [Treponema sp.]